MNPTDTSSHHQREPVSRGRSILIFIAFGIPLLLVCGCAGLMVVGLLFGRPGSGPATTYTYHDFEIFGPLDEARELHTAETLPASIEVEASDGRRVALSSLNWKTARALAGSNAQIQDAGDGTVWLQLFDPIPHGESRLTVEFTSQQVKGLTACEKVTIHNTASGQSVTLPAKWSDIERCFGKPARKS